MWDGQRALKLVRTRARDFGSDDLDHLQAYLSGQNHITAGTPPVFLFESMDDQRISPQNSVIFVDALKRAGIPVEPHVFPHGVHGAGNLGRRSMPDLFLSMAQWPALGIDTLEHR
jgi:dipeptidyl aminopeptidase/acylaminoacyl peptidase